MRSQDFVMTKLNKLYRKEMQGLYETLEDYASEQNETGFLRTIKRLAKEAPRTVGPMPYVISKGIFETQSGNCSFNPATCYAHSYDWYDLCKVINGHVVLNTYRYSSQTSNHIWNVGQILKMLGIKYLTVEAPSGLQNMEAALTHELEIQSEAMVRLKYARKVKTWERLIIRESEKRVKTLAMLGIKATAKQRKAFIDSAESDRIDRNKELRERRKERKGIEAIEVIIDADALRYGEAGYHKIIPHLFHNGDYYGCPDLYKREAYAKGFNRLFIHADYPQHIRVLRRFQGASNE